MAGGCHHFCRRSRRPDGSSQLVGGTEESGRPSASIVIVHRPCCRSVLPRCPFTPHCHQSLFSNARYTSPQGFQLLLPPNYHISIIIIILIVLLLSSKLIVA